MKRTLTALCIAAAVSAAATAQTFDWIETAGYPVANLTAAEICGHGVGIDAAGNVYVAGTYHDSISIGSTALSCSSKADIFIAKYSADGIAQWAKTINNDKELKTGGIAVDASGNCYVAGNFNSTTNFNGTEVVSDQSGSGYTPAYGFYMISLDTDGNNRWVQTSTGNQVNTFSGVAINGAGTAAVLFGVPNATALTIGGQTVNKGGYVIAGLNTADGTLAWTTIDGTSMIPGTPAGIDVDASGNIVIAGSAGFFGVTIGDSTLAANKVYTAKYDNSGTLQWLRTGSGGTIACVSFDGAGNAYMGGTAAAGATFGSETATDNAAFLVKYDAAGTIGRLFNTPNDGVTGFTALADAGDGVAAAVTFQIKAYVGSDSVTTTAAQNSTYLATFASDGTHSILGAGQSSQVITAKAAATGPSGELCVTGTFRLSIEFGGVSGTSSTAIGAGALPEFFVMKASGAVGIDDHFVTTPAALPQGVIDGYYDLSGKRLHGTPECPGMYVGFGNGAAQKLLIVE